MKNLKVRVYKDLDDKPETTVTIPGGVLRLASKLIPKRAQEAMLAEGIDLNEIVNLAEQPDVQGTIVEVEDHEKNERVVIAFE
jgi:hypothetical protein